MAYGKLHRQENYFDQLYKSVHVLLILKNTYFYNIFTTKATLTAFTLNS